MVLMKPTRRLIIAKNIDRLRCIIMLCYLVESYFYLYHLCNIVLVNYHVDFNVTLHIMYFYTYFR